MDNPGMGNDERWGDEFSSFKYLMDGPTTWDIMADYAMDVNYMFGSLRARAETANTERKGGEDQDGGPDGSGGGAECSRMSGSSDEVEKDPGNAGGSGESQGCVEGPATTEVHLTVKEVMATSPQTFAPVVSDGFVNPIPLRNIMYNGTIEHTNPLVTQVAASRKVEQNNHLLLPQEPVAPMPQIASRVAPRPDPRPDPRHDPRLAVQMNTPRQTGATSFFHHPSNAGLFTSMPPAVGGTIPPHGPPNPSHDPRHQNPFAAIPHIAPRFPPQTNPSGQRSAGPFSHHPHNTALFPSTPLASHGAQPLHRLPHPTHHPQHPSPSAPQPGFFKSGVPHHVFAAPSDPVETLMVTRVLSHSMYSIGHRLPPSVEASQAMNVLMPTGQRNFIDGKVRILQNRRGKAEDPQRPEKRTVMDLTGPEMPEAKRVVYGQPSDYSVQIRAGTEEGGDAGGGVEQVNLGLPSWNGYVDGTGEGEPW